MKAIHLAIRATGGAGIAAARSVSALRRQQVEAELWTADGSGLGPALRSARATRWRARLDAWRTKCYRQRREFSAWSNNVLPSSLAQRINAAAPDIVNLHWIGAGFLSLHELARFKAPLVWTFHDPWAFTGGCHYPDDCLRFRQDCGRCPQLGSEREEDLSRANLQAKRHALAHIRAVVSPSRWLADLAKSSRSVDADRCHVIPYGLDESVFTDCDRRAARHALGWPEDACVLVAGAHHLGEKRKGCHLLPEALERIVAGHQRRVILAFFGAGEDLADRRWSCETRPLGKLTDEKRVAEVCRAADLLLMPSLQDNFPNIALEAQACGCPVVGFATGGLTEIVAEGVTGHTTPEASAQGLAQATLAWLSGEAARGDVRSRCRAHFLQHFTLDRHGQRMRQLYEQCLETRP